MRGIGQPIGGRVAAKVVTTAIVTFAMLFGTTRNASAAPVSESNPNAGAVVIIDDADHAPDGARVVTADAELAPEFVSEVEGVVQPLLAATADAEFDPEAALERGASAQEVADYAEVFAAQGGAVMSTVESQPTTFATEAAATAKACKGVNGYRGFYASGPQWALDSCKTSQLIASAGLGASGAAAEAAILAFAGAPQGAALAGIVAAIIGLGVGFLTVCQSFRSNGGIYLNGGLASTIPPSCWGQ